MRRLSLRRLALAAPNKGVLPYLPPGYAFVTSNGVYVTDAGRYVIARVA